MSKLLGILVELACINYSFCNTKILEQIQILHKDIGSDLMSIRKEFTAAQPKVYSLLDRIDKMYNLAKVAAEKKDLIKTELKNKISENKRLQSELSNLKIKILTAEKELENSSKKFTSLNKELQVERVQTAILSREKKEISQEKNELQAQITDSSPNNGKTKESKKGSNSDTDSLLKSLTEEEKNILKTSQNLSLSSTSAPNSPR
jgi:phosphoglycerate-specific signal transduction histidine kinase